MFTLDVDMLPRSRARSEAAVLAAWAEHGSGRNADWDGTGGKGGAWIGVDGRSLSDKSLRTRSSQSRLLPINTGRKPPASPNQVPATGQLNSLGTLTDEYGVCCGRENSATPPTLDNGEAE